MRNEVMLMNFRMWWWTKRKSPFEEGALRGI